MRDLCWCTHELKLSQCLRVLDKYDEALKLLQSSEDVDLRGSLIGEKWKHQVLLAKAQCLFGL